MNKGHIMGCPSVSFLNLVPEWWCCRGCPYRLLVPRRDGAAIEDEIGVSSGYESDRMCIIRVHLIVGSGFVICVHIELCFEWKVAVDGFVVLVSFYMSKIRYNVQLCTGGGDGWARFILAD